MFIYFKMSFEYLKIRGKKHKNYLASSLVLFDARECA